MTKQPNLTVVEVFAAGGLTPSQTQLEYSEFVRHGLQEAVQKGHGQIMVEGETGVGKTMGYLIPAMMSAVETGGRIVVSTYTKALQAQILKPGGDAERCVNAVEKATGTRLKVAKLIGKGNYFDSDRVADLINDLKQDNLLIKAGAGKQEVIDQWESLLEQLNNNQLHEISEYIENFDELPGGIASEVVCLNGASKPQASEFYRAAASAARDADVLITNHALLTTSSLYRSYLLHDEDDKREITAFIIDEADRMPDACRSMVTQQFPAQSVNRLLKKWAQKKAVEKDPAFMKFDEAFHTLSGYLDEIAPKIAINDLVLIDKIPADLHKTLIAHTETFVLAYKGYIGVLEAAKRNEDDYDLVADLIRYCNTVVSFYGLATNGEQGAHGVNKRKSKLPVIQYSPTRKYPSLSLLHLNPSKILRNLWVYLKTGAIGNYDDGEIEHKKEGAALVLTSATLSAPGDRTFTDMKMEFGIFDMDNPCSRFSKSFALKKFGTIKKVVFPDVSVHKPYEGEDVDTGEIVINEEWAEYTARMIAKTYSKGERTLALFSSYRVAAYIAIKLQGMGITFPVIVKSRRQSLKEVAEQLRDSVEGGVLITPSGWEGLDTRSMGFSLDNVLIGQIPVRSKTTVHSQAIICHLLMQGYSESKAEGVAIGSVMNSAYRQLKQGIGRGIRQESDNFTLWFADPRIPLPNALLMSETIALPNRKSSALTQIGNVLPDRFKHATPFSVMLKTGDILDN